MNAPDLVSTRADREQTAAWLREAMRYDEPAENVSLDTILFGRHEDVIGDEFVYKVFVIAVAVLLLVIPIWGIVQMDVNSALQAVTP